MNDVEEIQTVADSETGKKDGAPLPGPGTFSFEDYVLGNSTFPEFHHTVYIDQATGLRLQHLIEEYEKRADEVKHWNAVADGLRKNVTDMVSDDLDTLNDNIQAATERLEMIELEMEQAKERIHSTSIKLSFKVSTVDKLTSVVREAERAFIKKHGRGGGDDDINHMAMKSRYILLAQLSAHCTRVTLADGRVNENPTEKDFGILLDRMISSESVRLLQALNKGLDSSSVWADRVDAGFPGGGADMA